MTSASLDRVVIVGFLAIVRRDHRIVGAIGMNMPGALAGWRARLGTIHG
jgi:hypothetical protein